MKRMLTLTVMAGTMAIALSATACDRFPSFRPSNGYGYSSRYAPRYGQGYTWPRTYAKTPVYVEEVPVVIRRAPVKPVVRQPIVKPPVIGLPPAGPDVNPLPLPPEDLAGPATVTRKPADTATGNPADLPDLPLPPVADATAPATPVVPNPMDEQIAPKDPVVVQQQN